MTEDHYFGDTARCLEWFVADAIRSNVDLFVIDGDLTTYKRFVRAKASHAVHLCTEPEFIELDGVVTAVFPYPRKAEFVGADGEHDM